MTKQKILQIIVAVVTVLGVVAGLAPEVNMLPASWQPYGLGMVGIAIGLEKILISTNQILVGPAKLQTAATQEKLAALPDKSTDSTNDKPAD
jgi:hypothetical protein